MKQGVGEPNSQMGKSYANNALRRANQCSQSALPRDWLAPEEGGAAHPESRPSPFKYKLAHPHSRASQHTLPPPPPPPAALRFPSQQSESARVNVCVCEKG